MISSFHGEFEHAVDAKGRTSLPVKFRGLLVSEQEDEVVISPALDPSYLMCHSKASFERLLAGAQELPPFGDEALFFIETVVNRAHTCGIDKLGRIQLPPKLREAYGIKGSVTWAGAIDHVQVWDTAAYETMQRKRHETRNQDLARSVASKLRPRAA